MGDNADLKQMNEVLEKFSERVSDLQQQPAAVDKAFRQVAAAAATAEGSIVPIIGTAIGATYGAITGDDFTGYLGRHEDEIKNKIKSIIGSLSDAISALAAPVAFLNLSDDWSQIKTKIKAAQDDEFGRGVITVWWQGVAADRYEAARALQDTALDSTIGLCETVHTSLVEISNACWKFYSDIVTQLFSLLSALLLLSPKYLLW